MFSSEHKTAGNGLILNLFSRLIVCAAMAWMASPEAWAQPSNQSPSTNQPLAHRPAPMRKTATNLTRFGVPFQITDPQDNFIEVQLYVSRDQGQSWQFYGRQSTAARDFQFQTSGDGTYWFSLKTLDRDRQLHPEGPAQAEMEVVVDTVDPELDFRVETDAAGRLVCRWRASDDNIDPQSVALSFRPLLSGDDRENAWIPVAYRPVTEAQGKVFADQYAWWPDTPAREVLVQLQISDRAGNRAVEERQVVIPQTANLSRNASMVTRGTVTPSQSQTNPTQALPSEAQEARPSVPARDPSSPNFPANAPTEVEQRDDPYGKVVDAFRPTLPGTVLPNTNTGDESNSGAIGPEAVSPVSSGTKIIWDNQRSTSDGMQESANSTWPTLPDERPVVSVQSTATPLVPQSGDLQKPPVGDANFNAEKNEEMDTPAPSAESMSPLPPLPKPLSRSLPERDNQSAASSVPSQIPSAVPASSARDASYSRPPVAVANSVVQQPDGPPDLGLPRFDSVSSRRIRIGYKLDRLTPGDVEKVVMWITSDRGQTWTAYGEDPDKESPFAVELPGAGMYGFKVVFHTVDGLEGRPPARGEEADYWVRVDLEHPQAQLSGAPYGSGAESGCLIVQWSASDELLADRPVTLAYSTGSQGPWTLIDVGIENSGRYAWRVGKEVPEKVFLKLEVVDAAGNVATNQTLDAVDLSGLVPKARITGVEQVK